MKRSVSKRRVSKRRVSKRSVSKRSVSKRSVSKRRVSKRRVSKRIKKRILKGGGGDGEEAGVMKVINLSPIPAHGINNAKLTINEDMSAQLTYNQSDREKVHVLNSTNTTFYPNKPGTFSFKLPKTGSTGSSDVDAAMEYDVGQKTIILDFTLKNCSGGCMDDIKHLNQVEMNLRGLFTYFLARAM